MKCPKTNKQINKQKRDKVTILLGDKSPIEQEAIGAILQNSHLLF
jgi:hypothetical protein